MPVGVRRIAMPTPDRPLGALSPMVAERRTRHGACVGGVGERMMTIGSISLERGERAVRDEEPESERLFRCVLLKCTTCGASDHAARPPADLTITHSIGLGCRCGAVLSYSEYRETRRRWGMPVVWTSSSHNYGSMLPTEEHWHLRPVA